ncbi:MAG: hypothetical protein ACKOZT_06130 [Cyanobium sp.]
MTQQSPSPRQALLALLAGSAALLAIKSLLWPRWPSAQPLQPEVISNALQTAGFEARPQRPLPAHRSYERSTSAGLRFAIGEGQSLSLIRGRVRERLTLQAALLANADPGSRLQQRRLVNGPPRSALGTLAGAPTRQTCLVVGKKGSSDVAVVGDALLQLVEQQPRSRADRLESLLGLRQPLDYGCVLISVSSAPAQGAISEPRWQRLLMALQQALERDPS